MNKTTLTLGVGATDKTVTASVEPAGSNQEMTITSADTKVATATLTGGTIQITGVAAGAVKVTVASKTVTTVKTELAVTITVAK